MGEHSFDACLCQGHPYNCYGHPHDCGCSPKLPDEIDMINLQAVEKRHRAAHIAGLKEASELVAANSAWMGNARFVLDAISARIKELEGQ